MKFKTIEGAPQQDDSCSTTPVDPNQIEIPKLTQFSPGAG